VKPVAIFRFSPTEGPGHFGEWIGRQGIPQKLFALDRGDSVPAEARAFAGIGMMGGPMSANDDLPWNAPLLGLIRDAISADVPVIGHCLGGQLLAKSLGAAVARTATPEIGWSSVEVIDAACNPWFNIGFQCHIEMTREMVESWCASGGDELPPQSTGAVQSMADIFEDVDARLATLSRVADDVYARWAQGLAR